jgi:hypothetical protein
MKDSRVFSHVRRFLNNPPINWILITASALVGIIYFFLAISADRWDWFISEYLAEIFYSSVRLGEFPYFSFFYNYGTYFLQEPQIIFFSPTGLLAVIFGPSLGLRLAAALLGITGTFFMIRWLMRSMSVPAAVFSSLSWSLSLVFFWRIAIGNDMFLWYHALCPILLFLENLLKVRSFRNAFILASVGGIYVLSPTFQSSLFFNIWCIAAFTLAYFIFNLRIRDILNSLKWMGVVFLTVGCLAAYRIGSWIILSRGIERPVIKDPALSIELVLYGCTNYFQVLRTRLLHSRWQTEEWAVAPNPLVFIFVLVAILIFIRNKSAWRTMFFAGLIFLFGAMMASTDIAWDFLYNITGRNIRCPERFLTLVTFASCVISGYGVEWVLKKIPNNTLRKMAGIGILLTPILFAVIWMNKAQSESGCLTKTAAGETLKRMSEDYTYEVKTLRRMLWLRHSKDYSNRQMLNGYGVLNAFEFNGGHPERRPTKRFSKKAFIQGKLKNFVAYHTSAIVRSIPKAGTVLIRTGQSKNRFEFILRPRTKRYAVDEVKDGIRFINQSDAAIDELIIRAKNPVPRWLAALSIMSWCFILSFLVCRKYLLCKKYRGRTFHQQA